MWDDVMCSFDRRRLMLCLNWPLVQYWSSVRNAKVYLGADVDSDHSRVVATVAVKLKGMLRTEKSATNVCDRY